MSNLLKLFLLFNLAVLARAQCFRNCKKMLGPDCTEDEYIIENSCYCIRRCINRFPIACKVYCPVINDRDCPNGHTAVTNYCGCRNDCYKMLDQKSSCGKSRRFMCGDGLKCLDGVCVPV